jgi:hypothetical protein
MKVTINNKELNFKIRYETDNIRRRTITFRVNCDRNISSYDWEKISDFIEKTIN